MGSAQSTAVSQVDSVINDTLNSLTSSYQQCASYVSQSQTVILHDCDEAEIDMTQAATMSMTCVMDADTTTDVVNQATTTGAASAESLVSGVSGSEADTSSLVASLTNLITNITTTYVATMQTGEAQSQNVVCDSSEGVVIDMKQLASSVSRSVMYTKTVSDAKAQAIADLEAVSQSTVKGLNLTMLLAIIALAIIGVLAFMAMGLKFIVTPAFWLLLAVTGTMAAGYFASTALTHLWPYENPDPADTQDDTDAKDAHNKSLLDYSLVGLGVGVVAVVGLGFLVWSMGKKKPKAAATPVV